MSGLFTDLAARAHGDTQAVRPRLPARFEPSAQDQLVELVVETPAAAPTDDPPERTPGERTIESIAAPDAATAAGQTAEPPAEPPTRPPTMPTRRPDPVAEAPGSRTEPRESHDATPLAPRVTLREPQAAAAAPQRPPAAAENPSTPLESIPEPSRPLAPRLRAARAETAQAPPAAVREETTVYVSIGRIELRAAENPPPPSARPREPARSAVMSLQDYLESRRAGR